MSVYFLGHIFFIVAFLSVPYLRKMLVPKKERGQLKQDWTTQLRPSMVSKDSSDVILAKNVQKPPSTPPAISVLPSRFICRDLQLSRRRMENILRPLIINIDIDIKMHFYIYFCVFKWGEGWFYKHLGKCLHEMTIVPHELILNPHYDQWRCLFFLPLVCIFLSFVKKMWNLETWGCFNRVLLFSPGSLVFVFPIVILSPPPTVNCGRVPAETVGAQGQCAPHSYHRNTKCM